MTELFTTEEAAEFLQISKSRVRQLLNDNKITGIKTPTTNRYRGEWRINKDSLVEYLANRRKVGRPRTK